MTNYDDFKVIIDKLRLPHKEGFSIDDYVNCVNRLPTFAEWEGGTIPRTNIFRLHRKELSNCAKLEDFLQDFLISLVKEYTQFRDEIVDDFSSSIYLAISGHYRQAIALLRFACENALLDTFFELNTGYTEWENGNLFLPSGARLIEECFGKGTHIVSFTKKHIQVLNKYVHIGNKSVTNNELIEIYVRESFMNWYKLYVNSFILIIRALLAYGVLRGKGKYIRWSLIEDVTGISREKWLNPDWIWEGSA